MGRTVISRRDVVRARAQLGSSGPQVEPEPDHYPDRLVKYIPPDVIVAYTAIEGLIGASKEPNAIRWAWVAFAVILGATPVYLVKLANVRKPLQVLISTVAFVAWALAYPAPPFKDTTGGLASTVVLALYTFLIPLFTVT
jgi:hypothetical protein